MNKSNNTNRKTKNEKNQIECKKSTKEIEEANVRQRQKAIKIGQTKYTK
jgi:hypothetical protein